MTFIKLTFQLQNKNSSPKNVCPLSSLTRSLAFDLQIRPDNIGVCEKKLFVELHNNSVCIEQSSNLAAAAAAYAKLGRCREGIFWINPIESHDGGEGQQPNRRPAAAAAMTRTTRSKVEFGSADHRCEESNVLSP